MALYDCPNDAAITSGLSTIAPGDIFELYPGNTYAAFSVPSIANGTPVIFRAKGLTFTNGTRVGASTTLPVVRITDGNVDGCRPAGTGTFEWRGLEFRCDFTVDQSFRNLLAFGPSGVTAVASLPTNAVARHCRFNGGTLKLLRRALAANSNGGTIADCRFGPVEYNNEPTGIGQWNAAGSFDIYNNEFNQVGSGILIGGAPNTLPYTTLPPRVTIERNYFYWPPSWSTAGVDAKSHIEFKHWIYPRIIGNVFQNFWAISQNNVINFSDYSIDEGYAVGGKGGQILFNKFLNCGEKVFNLSSRPGGLPVRAIGMRIAHNFGLVGRNPNNGTGASNPMILAFQHGLTIERNTFLADQNINMFTNSNMQSEGGSAWGIRFNRNIFPGSDAGTGFVFTCGGSPSGLHQAGLDAMATTGNWECTGNAFGGTTYQASNPTGNTHLANNAALASALHPTTYDILSTGALAGMTVGANMSLVRSATDNVVAGTVGTTRIKSDWAF